MLTALPVLLLLASTMVPPGRRSPSRSVRPIMYLAIRALMAPEGLRYSSLTQIPSTMIRGVLPIASRIVPPPRRTKPAAGARASSAADVAFMPAPHVCAAGPDPPSGPARRSGAGAPDQDVQLLHDRG